MEKTKIILAILHKNSAFLHFVFKTLLHFIKIMVVKLLKYKEINIMKKIISILLAFILMLTVYSVTSFGAKSGDFTYTVLSETDKTCKITAYSGSSKNVVIPAELDGYTVTALEMLTFYMDKALTVELPATVNTLDGQAFNQMNSTVNSITVAEDSPYFSSVDGVLYSKDKTILVVYPAGKSDETYKVIDGVKSIYKYAFSNTYITKDIILPDSLQVIEDNAFDACKSLVKINLPNGLKSIGFKAFTNCDSLESLVIPDSVTYIGTMAFGNSESLKSVSLPNTLEVISASMFQSCVSLESITIPQSVKTISEYAFQSCDSLVEVVIPDNVTDIGEYAFSRCDKLTNITIGEGVTTIGYGNFSECHGLEKITIDNNNQYYSSDEYGVLFNKDKTELIQYPKGNTRTNYTIPDSVTIVDDKAFYDCDNLTNVTISDSVTTIGDSVFSLSYNLTSITIGDSVTEISSSAFKSCPNLTNVTIGDSVTTIAYNAFYNCKSLASIIIPESVTEIGNYAFNACTKLTDVYYPGTEEQWNQIIIGKNNYPLTNSTIHYNYGKFTGVKGDYFYKDDVKQKAYQLVEFNGDFYFINDYHKIAKNKRIYLSERFVEGFTYEDGTPLAVGYYEFDESGKMIIKNGVVGDYFYKNGVRLNAYQLVEYEGDFYFINDSHKVAKNKRIYLSQSFVEGFTYADGTPLKVGYYEFDENGKMVILNGPVGDYFYKNNVRLNAYQLVEYEGDYYFINDSHKLAKNKRIYLSQIFVEGTDLKVGYYEFDDDGKMIIE